MAAFLVLTACGSSNHRYLADRDEKVYLRVPSRWHDIKPSDDIPDPLLQASTDARIISKSIVTPQSDATSQDDVDASAPVATMTVYETTGVLNQHLSPSLVRQIGLAPFDPLLPSTDEEKLAEVVDYDLNPTNAKISGSRVVYRYRSDPNSDWQAMVDLSTFFDASESRLYALEVVCSPGCFEDDAKEINSIVTSWRIG